MQNWLDYADISQEDYTILIENVPFFIQDGTQFQKEDELKLEYQIKNAIETKIRMWFEVLEIYKDESEITNEVDKDFFRFIYKKYREQVREAQIVTSITLCYDLTELQNINKAREDFIAEYIQDGSKPGSKLFENKPKEI